MNTSTCRVEKPANNDYCKIEYCLNCKIFHVRIGYATFHLKPEAFSALRHTVNAAYTSFQRYSKAIGQHAAYYDPEKPLH
jgi:hypothetical protein